MESADTFVCRVLLPAKRDRLEESSGRLPVHELFILASLHSAAEFRGSRTALRGQTVQPLGVLLASRRSGPAVPPAKCMAPNAVGLDRLSQLAACPAMSSVPPERCGPPVPGNRVEGGGWRLVPPDSEGLTVISLPRDHDAQTRVQGIPDLFGESRIGRL